jgi:hypothetical protein
MPLWYWGTGKHGDLCVVVIWRIGVTQQYLLTKKY